MRSLLPSFTGRSGKALDQLVRARKKRQLVLGRKSRSYVFVLGEASIRNQVGGPAVMLDQLENLLDSMERWKSLEVRILPFSTSLTKVPLHQFVIYDERTISIELSKGQVDLWTEDDVRYYTDIMNYLYSIACTPAKSRVIIEEAVSVYRSTIR